MEDLQLSEEVPEEEREDGAIAQEIEKLRQQTMRTWWQVCLALWLTVGLLSFWWLRSEFYELTEYFTWAAVRAAIYFERIPSLGLITCIGLTVGLLLSESRQILFGISRSERSRLHAQRNKIREQGPTHPQWKVICADESE